MPKPHADIPPSNKPSPESIRQTLEQAEQIHSPEAVAQAIERLAEAISATLQDADPLVLPIMKGGLIPAGWLLPKLQFPLQIDYLHATRYRDSTQGGELQWRHQGNTPLTDRKLLLLDDIYDQGITLASIRQWCEQQAPASIHTAVLFAKRHERNQGQMWPDFIGLEVPDRYVFGAGMDYHGYLRNLPGVYAVNGL